MGEYLPEQIMYVSVYKCSSKYQTRKLWHHRERMGVFHSMIYFSCHAFDPYTHPLSLFYMQNTPFSIIHLTASPASLQYSSHSLPLFLMFFHSGEEIQENDPNEKDSNDTHYDHHLAIFPPVFIL